MNRHQSQEGHWVQSEREREMEDGHAPSWRAMIQLMTETDLREIDVLDFGCNQGGFLRLLYDIKPFRSALGVDIAPQSVATAMMLKDGRPCEYATTARLTKKSAAFDIAFSHEVVYLLPDLIAHAKEMRRVLRPNGIYYMAIGVYAEHPLWPRWREVIAKFSPVPPVGHSLQDMAKAFQSVGFAVSVQKLACDGFFAYDSTDESYLRSPAELVKFKSEDMMLFRMQNLI